MTLGFGKKKKKIINLNVYGNFCIIRLPPDCEEWGKRAVPTKLCREFVWYHTGPVLEEETLSGKFLPIFSYITAHLP